MDKFYDKLIDIDVDLEVIQIAQKGVVRTSLGIQADILASNPDLNEVWAISELVVDKIEKVRKRLGDILDEVERQERDEKRNKAN